MGKRIKKKHETAKRIVRLQKKNRELKDGYEVQKSFYTNKLEKCLEEQEQGYLKELTDEASKHYAAIAKLEQAEIAKQIAKVTLHNEKQEHEKTKERMKSRIEILEIELEKERFAHSYTKRKIESKLNSYEGELAKYKKNKLVRLLVK